MKIKTAGIILLLLAFVFCAGCGDETGGSSESTPKAEVKLPEYEITGDTVTLLCWNSQSEVTSETGAYYEANKLLEENYNCSLKIIRTTYPELPTKAAALVLSNSSPDLIFYKAQDFPSFIKNNIAAETTQYVDFNDPLWSGLKDTYDIFKYQGKQYFMPYNKIYTDSLIFYWTSFFEDAGLDTPLEIYKKNPDDWTLSKLKEIMKDVTLDNNRDGIIDMYGLAMHPGEMYICCGEDFATLDAQSGRYANNLRSPAFNQYMNFMFDTNADGDNTRLMALNHIADFTAKNAAMMWSQVWVFNTFAEEITSGAVEFVISPKVDDADEWYVKGRVDGYWMGYNCKNPGGAAAFIACNAYMGANEEYKAQSRAKSKALYGWSDDIIALREEFDDGGKFKPLLLMTAHGLPEWGNTYQYNLWSDVSLFSGSWSACIDKYYPVLQGEIDKANGED